MEVNVLSGKLTPYVLISLFILLMCYEAAYPLRRRKRARGRRWLVNLALTALVFAVGGYLVRPAALTVGAWTAGRDYGLLQLLGLPGWGQMAAGFLLMDLTFYYWHRVNHTNRWLWRFHNVHHVDPDLDVSTSFRFHGVEILYSLLFRVAQVGLLGIMPLTYVLYELVFQAGTMFHHSNLKLPLKWERRVNKLLVTPRMHGVHHSAVGPETNSNYSVIFSWWDKLHGSLRLNVGQPEIVIGVPAYLLPRDNGIPNLIKMPFLKQRSYWRWPSGKASVRRRAGEAPGPGVMLE